MLVNEAAAALTGKILKINTIDNINERGRRIAFLISVIHIKATS
jgi:ribosomal protein S5